MHPVTSPQKQPRATERTLAMGQLPFPTVSFPTPATSPEVSFMHTVSRKRAWSRRRRRRKTACRVFVRSASPCRSGAPAWRAGRPAAPRPGWSPMPRCARRPNPPAPARRADEHRSVSGHHIHFWWRCCRFRLMVPWVSTRGLEHSVSSPEQACGGDAANQKMCPPTSAGRQRPHFGSVTLCRSRRHRRAAADLPCVCSRAVPSAWRGAECLRQPSGCGWFHGLRKASGKEGSGVVQGETLPRVLTAAHTEEGAAC